jgi:hypothetical protein
VQSETEENNIFKFRFQDLKIWQAAIQIADELLAMRYALCALLQGEF